MKHLLCVLFVVLCSQSLAQVISPCVPVRKSIHALQEGRMRFHVTTYRRGTEKVSGILRLEFEGEEVR